MVLDLMAQLDRECSERNKIETLLRDLLDARRNRKSEQLSADQLALFAAAWQARQESEGTEKSSDSDDDDPATPGAGEAAPQKRSGGRQPLAKHLKRERIVHDLADAEKHCATCQQDLRPIGEESSERYEFIPAQLGIPLTQPTTICRFGQWRITRERSRSSRRGFRPRTVAEHTW